MEQRKRSCIDCATRGCDGKSGNRPAFCLTDNMPEGMLDSSLEHYVDGEEARMLRAAAEVENDGYLRWNRVREVMEFAWRMGYKRLGIATCVGLLSESRTLAAILRSNGFEVVGASCKAGMVRKTDVGIPEECCSVGPNTCNPVLQAEYLDSQGTDLNIAVGLCVGHDCIFNRNSKAPVTTLVVKDRVMANNPVGALYTANSYCKGLHGIRGQDVAETTDRSITPADDD